MAILLLVTRTYIGAHVQMHFNNIANTFIYSVITVSKQRPIRVHRLNYKKWSYLKKTKREIFEYLQ